MARKWLTTACCAAALLLAALYLNGQAQQDSPAGEPPGHAHAHGTAVEVKILSAVDIAEKLDGKQARVTTLEVTIPPGAGSPPHRHPGPIFGYVLEGEFETQLGDGPVRHLKTGDTFYEPAMILHAVSRNPSETNPTRVLAVLVHPRDAKQLTIPEPTKGSQ